MAAGSKSSLPRTNPRVSRPTSVREREQKEMLRRETSLPQTGLVSVIMHSYIRFYPGMKAMGLQDGNFSDQNDRKKEEQFLHIYAHSLTVRVARERARRLTIFRIFIWTTDNQSFSVSPPSHRPLRSWSQRWLISSILPSPLLHPHLPSIPSIVLLPLFPLPLPLHPKEFLPLSMKSITWPLRIWMIKMMGKR